MEEWRDIEGFEGKYQVSTKGNIKSLERTVNCTLKNCKNKLIKDMCNLNIDVTNAINTTIENSEYYNKKHIYDSLED